MDWPSPIHFQLSAGICINIALGIWVRFFYHMVKQALRGVKQTGFPGHWQLTAGCQLARPAALSGRFARFCEAKPIHFGENVLWVVFKKINQYSDVVIFKISISLGFPVVASSTFDTKTSWGLKISKLLASTHFGLYSAVLWEMALRLDF